MAELWELSAVELAERIRRRDVSAQDAVASCLSRIKALDDGPEGLNAFCRTFGEQALAEAEAVDDALADDRPVGPLAGVPVGIKDAICVAGQVASAGSKMLASYRPPFDATVVSRLRKAGAIPVGMTNMDEFAMGSSTEHSVFGPTKNPHARTAIPGGSSGGSAAAVAARLVPLALGSDTGGSIRQPAAHCGLVGLKPTYGRVSRFGLVAFASSLDQIGPMANTAEDAAALLHAIGGLDPLDSTSLAHDVPDYAEEMARPLTGLTVGVVRDHFAEGLADDVATAVMSAVDVLREAGARVVDVRLPRSLEGIACYYIIAPAEASSNLARYDGVHFGHRCYERAMLESLAAERTALTEAGDSVALARLDSPLVRMYRQSRSEGFGPEVKRRIMLGTYALSAGYFDQFYAKAAKVRRLIREEYDTVLTSVDCLVGPVTPTAAFALGSKTGDPLEMYLSDIYTVATNLAGLPGLSIPCGRTADGRPIGLHLQGRFLDEGTLLRVAHQFQSLTDHHHFRPIPSITT